MNLLMTAERQLAALRRSDPDVESALGRRRQPSTVLSLNLRRACSGLDATVKHLHMLVAAADRELGCGSARSLGELALRAKTLALLVSLDQLSEVFRAAGPQTSELFAGRLRTSDDVAAFVLDRLSQINRRWLRWRRLIERSPRNPGCLSNVQAAYVSAVRDAQIAMLDIGHDPAMGQFLYTAIKLGWPELRAGCLQIVVVLSLTFGLESTNPSDDVPRTQARYASVTRASRHRVLLAERMHARPLRRPPAFRSWRHEPAAQRTDRLL